jgi:hypothetical protein
MQATDLNRRSSAGVYEVQSARRTPATAAARTAFTKCRARAAPGGCACTDGVHDTLPEFTLQEFGEEP